MTKSVVQSFPKTYDYSKVKDVLDISDVYTPVAQLETGVREVGTYEFKISMTYKLNLANKSVFYRWRVNGGNWNELIAEPKDKTDSTAVVYYYPYEHTGGKFKVEVEMKKEDTNGQLDVYFHDLIFERKS